MSGCVPRICSRCGAKVTGPCSCRNRYTKARGANKAYDWQWRKFRKDFLARARYVCHDCQGPATEVHHIVKVKDAPHLRLEASNCMALCAACHAIRTRRGE